MFEKGPGEGYMAARADALALRPGLRCERRTYAPPGATPLTGFIVYDGDKALVSAASARAAWNKVLDWLKQEPSHD